MDYKIEAKRRPWITHIYSRLDFFGWCVVCFFLSFFFLSLFFLFWGCCIVLLLARCMVLGQQPDNQGSKSLIGSSLNRDVETVVLTTYMAKQHRHSAGFRPRSVTFCVIFDKESLSCEEEEESI